MYVCEECKSTEFEKVGGFLFCLVCQVQQKDYIEYGEDVEPKDDMGTPWSDKKTEEWKKREERRRLKEKKILIDNWTPWDTYNHIILGFVNELKSTGLAPKELESTVLSLWMAYISKTFKQEKKSPQKNPATKKPTKRKTEKICRKRVCTRKTYSPKKSIKKACTPKKNVLKTAENTFLAEDIELLHIDKRRKIDEQKYDDDEENLIFTPLSQASSCSVKQLERRMIERQYQEFLCSEEQKATDVLAHETIETVGKEPVDDLPSSPTPDILSPSTSSVEEDSSPTNKRKRDKKAIPMCKGRALELLHLGLLLCGSDIQLSDLLRFIREAHIAFAKVTHFLPPEIKVTRENYNYLETVRDVGMPKHLQQRKLGADMAKILGVQDFPFPDFSGLIKRYVTELKLPVQVASYAVLLSQIAEVEKLCSFRRSKKRIPNYEGMAAACIIVAMKFLFGLDDQTEFLLSDMAKKTNKLLKEKSNPDSVKLFPFQEWKKFFELRLHILSILHYPTDEKVNVYPSTSGFLDMIIKESKDPDRVERFESYSQYHLNSDLLDATEEVLNALRKPKEDRTMEFPATLTPQTDYLKAILKDYEDRKKGEGSPSMSGYIQFSEITDWAMTLLLKHYEKRQVFYMHKPEEYKKLLRENGYEIRTLSKLDQIKLTGGTSQLSKKGASNPQDEEEEYDSDSDVGSERYGSDAHGKDEGGCSGSQQDREGISSDKTCHEKMNISEEESGMQSGDTNEKGAQESIVEESVKKKLKRMGGRDWLKIILKKNGKHYSYYVAKPENNSYKKIEQMPKIKYKGSTWSDIRYRKLSSSKRVYFVEDMAVMWKLDSPLLLEDCNDHFMYKVFSNAPENFQWIVYHFADMLEMDEKEIYEECYKLESALEKARNLSGAKIKARIQ